MTDPKERLANALALTGPGAALTALCPAIAWAADSLSATIVGADDLSALEAVIGLSDALADLERLLGNIPALVELAAPGGPVQERMTGQQVTLTKLTSELDAHRAALEAAGDIERQLAQAQAQRDEVGVQIAMLERQHQLAAELPGMRVTLDKLREATGEATARPAEQVAQGLVAAVRELAGLTQEQRDLVGQELAQLAAGAVSSGEALASQRAAADNLRAEVATRLAEADELKREHAETLPGLELYRQADQELAGALAEAGLPSGTSALDSVRSSLADIGQRLGDMDKALKPLLEEHASAYAEARRVRNWSG